MKNLKFKYAQAENFLCFKNIEIDFESYGKIVLIKGKNLDVRDQEGEKASNGSGKSSIPEIVVYALYGKTIKKPKKITHLDMINNSDGKKFSVEFRWDNYRVVRKRNHHNQGTLQLWESPDGTWNKSTELTKGTDTQKEIEKRIGLTYESFINIFVFSDDNTIPFLECDSTAKRGIVENILSLEKYRGYSENAKNLTKNLKAKIKDLTKEYEFLYEQKDGCTKRVAQLDKQEKEWYEKVENELEDILKEIKNKRDELEKSATGAALATYNESQERINDLKLRLPVLDSETARNNEILDDVNLKYDNMIEKINVALANVTSFKKEIKLLENAISDNEETIKNITDKSGKSCPYCLNLVDESKFSNVIAQASKVIDSKKGIFALKLAECEKEQAEYNKLIKIKKKVETGIKDIKDKISNADNEKSEIHFEISELSKINKPDSAIAELLLAEQLENLKKQCNEKNEQLKGKTPFDSIKQSTIEDLNNKIQDCKSKKVEIKESEDLVPYYEFWVKAFGDNGIRKYVIDGIIPTLNDRIEYWLQFLIDNKMQLKFNNELDETIDRYPFNGKPYIYHAMSGGQRRMLNLTVASSWAFVSALNSGASPSAIFLDEVSMNVDAVGVLGIYRMICELSKEKQVFVIDHNEALLEMLRGCDTIDLEMKDEISKKV